MFKHMPKNFYKKRETLGDTPRKFYTFYFIHIPILAVLLVLLTVGGIGTLMKRRATQLQNNNTNPQVNNTKLGYVLGDEDEEDEDKDKGDKKEEKEEKKKEEKENKEDEKNKDKENKEDNKKEEEDKEDKEEKKYYNTTKKYESEYEYEKDTEVELEKEDKDIAHKEKEESELKDKLENEDENKLEDELENEKETEHKFKEMELKFEDLFDEKDLEDLEATESLEEHKGIKELEIEREMEDGKLVTKIKVKTAQGTKLKTINTATGTKTIADVSDATGALLSIRVAKDGTIVLSSEGLNVQSKSPIVVDPTTNTVHVVGNNNNTVQLKQAPSTVLSNVAPQDKPTIVESAVLGEQDGIAYYEFTGQYKTKFLGVIPIKAQVVTKVNATNGTVVEVQKPWYLKTLKVLFR